MKKINHKRKPFSDSNPQKSQKNFKIVKDLKTSTDPDTIDKKLRISQSKVKKSNQKLNQRKQLYSFKPPKKHLKQKKLL
jgi:hypothetical protein